MAFHDKEFSAKNPASIAVMSEALENLTLLLGPFVPHLADELWEQLGKRGTTYQTDWPSYDPEIAKADIATIVLQINGKVRDRMEVPADLSAKDVEEMALANERVQSMLDGRPVRKVIVVPGKLVNIVV
jgi:leucyl-tRNA synthetase